MQQHKQMTLLDLIRGERMVVADNIAKAIGAYDYQEETRVIRPEPDETIPNTTLEELVKGGYQIFLDSQITKYNEDLRKSYDNDVITRDDMEKGFREVNELERFRVVDTNGVERIVRARKTEQPSDDLQKGADYKEKLAKLRERRDPEGIEKKEDEEELEKSGVSATMKEFKEGKLKSGSGKKVTNKKQAIAIGLSEEKDK